MPPPLRPPLARCASLGRLDAAGFVGVESRSKVCNVFSCTMTALAWSALATLAAWLRSSRPWSAASWRIFSACSWFIDAMANSTRAACFVFAASSAASPRAWLSASSSAIAVRAWSLFIIVIAWSRSSSAARAAAAASRTCASRAFVAAVCASRTERCCACSA